MDISSIMLIIGLAVAAFLILKLLTKPIKLVFKLALNAFFGFIGLWLVNFFGDIIGVSIDINLINALIVGVLGIPGIIVLILFG